MKSVKRYLHQVTIVAAVATVLGATGFALWYSRLVVADVSYGECEASYGDIVYEWSGAADSEWDQAGYHYQTRSFSLIAHAHDTTLPNTAELNPTRIATGGQEACADIDETIDTVNDYRWNNIRAVDLRLGVPDRVSTERFTSAQARFWANRSELSTPVYRYSKPAAVWVDDAASVSLTPKDSDDPLLLWCINHQPCDDLTTQYQEGPPLRGSGYQYVTDNCPSRVECTDDWYDSSVFEQVKTNHFVEPFDLRLSAVSTYADRVGAEMLMTFKYPVDTQIYIESSEGTLNLLPRQAATTELQLHKTGPAIDNLSIRFNQDRIEDVVFERDEGLIVDELNTNDSLVAGLLISLGDVSPNRCYEENIELIATTQDQELSTQTSFSYCVVEPAAVYTFSVNTIGGISANLDEFIALTTATLQDSRGWSGANISFRRVTSGGDFTLWLSHPDYLVSFSAMCSPSYSCRVGRDVIINDLRWQNATSAWREAGGSLRDYRHMVVNHEVGHWLGLGHYNCPASGARAPVMMQQSIDLQDCRINPWPVQSELDAISS